MTLPSNPQILREAADHLESVEWFQGSGGDTKGQGCSCIYLAIWDTATVYMVQIPRERAARVAGMVNALCKHLNIKAAYSDGETSALIAWNDSQERTKEEVVAALRTCADKLERQALVEVLRQHITIDVTNKAPAVTSAIVVGFEEAARDILADRSKDPRDILRERIKVDATGLAPALAVHYLTGLEDAAQAVRTQ